MYHNNRFLFPLFVILLFFLNPSCSLPPSDQQSSLRLLASIYSLNWDPYAPSCNSAGVSCDSNQNVIGIIIGDSIPIATDSPVIILKPVNFTTNLIDELVEQFTGVNATTTGGTGPSSSSGTVSGSYPTTTTDSGGIGTGTSSGSYPTTTTGGIGIGTVSSSMASTSTGMPTTSTTSTTNTTTSTTSTTTSTPSPSPTPTSTPTPTPTPSPLPVIHQNFTFPYLQSFEITRQLSPAVTYDIMSYLGNLPSLRSLTIRYQPAMNSFPGNLSSPNLENITVTSIPSPLIITFPSKLANLSSLINIDFSNNHIYMIPNDYIPPISLKSLIMDNNTLGSIPDSLCSIKSASFMSNSLSSLPSCYSCYWEYTSSWFSSNPSLPTYTPGVCSNLTLNYSNGSLILEGATSSLTGTNLGWGSTITPGLKVVIPNRQFNYTFPLISMGVTSVQLNFSSFLSKTISWVYANPVINNITITQVSNLVKLEISGSFQTTGSVIKLLINDVEITNGVTFSSTSVSYNLSNSIDQGNLKITITTSFGSVTQYKLYTLGYPIVTSTLIENGKVHLYGLFSTSVAINSLKINNVTVNNTIIVSDSEVTCDLPSNLPIGESQLDIDQGGFKFTSDFVLYNFDPNPACANPCMNGGECVEGECKCADSWMGPQCTLKSVNDATIPSSGNNADNQVLLMTESTAPTAIFSFQDITFNFKVHSIQELNTVGTVIKEIFTSEWIASEPNDDTIIYDNGKTEPSAFVKIQISKEPRSFEFAEKTYQLEANSIKLSMNISNWQYQSSLNSLQVVLKTDLEQVPQTSNCGITTSGDSSLQIGNSTGSTIKYLSMSKKGVVFYGRFLDQAYSDGRVSYSANTILSKDSDSLYIGIKLPKCSICLLDPDFSILLDPENRSDSQDDCDESNSRSWVIPVAVTIPIIGVAAIVVGVFIVKKKFYFYKTGKSFTSFRFVSRTTSKANIHF